MSMIATDTQLVTVKELRHYLPAIRAVAKNNGLPMLNRVQLECTPEETWLSATDLDMELKVNLPATGFSFTHTYDVKQLANALKGAKGEVTLDDDGNISIGRFCLKPEGGENLPTLQKKGEPIRFDVNVDHLVAAAKYASVDQTRYIMNSVCFHWEHGKIYATDGIRLVQFPMKEDATKSNMVVPLKAVDVLKKLKLNLGAWASAYDRCITFSYGDIRLTTKLLDGTYPNCRQAIPSVNCYNSTWDLSTGERKELIEFLKLNQSPKKDKSVLLQGSGSVIRLTHHGDENAGVKPIEFCGYFGIDRHIALNPDFLIDCVEDSETLWIKDELSPLLTTDHEQVRTVLMPIRR